MPIGAFHWSSGVTLLALLVYFSVTAKTGQARLKFGVKAPATSGAPEFERAFRIQQNTLEQLMLFLPSLWLFAALVSDLWAGAAGVVAGTVVVILLLQPDDTGGLRVVLESRHE